MKSVEGKNKILNDPSTELKVPFLENLSVSLRTNDKRK